MRRFLIVSVVLLACLTGYSLLYLHQHLLAMDQKISALTKQVTETVQIAQRDAAAISVASARATEAAGRAEVAAVGRAQAEQQRDQAQAAQGQAESAARQATEQANESKTQLEALQKQRQEELNQMQQALNHVVETKRTPNGMVMVLPDSTFKFDFDSADLKPRNRELLSRIAGILLASKGFGLSVYGYTDDIGTKQYNQKLSEHRAESVRDYLVQAGIEPSLVDAKGFGKTNPRVEGETEQARAINRRVEIAVTDSEIKYTGLADQ
ncbi:MAG: OmpA family protein [Acidobacteriaceae bacterium]|nr:OmpA family protein [Acidobacteriaceae bacterium]MBV9501160.1 OmpA family protein [Acidobacteriaceae bacterium]